jgi:hypothetical protein
MSNKSILALLLISVLLCFSCTPAQVTESGINTAATKPTPQPAPAKIENPGRDIHVMVALCDNENQGIVPVPAHLGNGEDPARNLYWGAAYGVKTFFTKSKNWEKLAEIANPKPNVLERLVFKHRTHDTYLVADAYRGNKMKETIDDFFSGISGERVENVEAANITLQIMGTSDVIAFVGHNGLMDFELSSLPMKHDDKRRDAIILACASRGYFSKPLKRTGAEPLLWTSNLMAPEAYILHDAIEGWVRSESPQQIRLRAAAAYAKYQRISLKSAQNLLITGW